MWQLLLPARSQQRPATALQISQMRVMLYSAMLLLRQLQQRPAALAYGNRQRATAAQWSRQAVPLQRGALRQQRQLGIWTLRQTRVGSSAP